MNNREAENELKLDEIVDAFTEQLERGERPSIEDYKQRHPELAERIDAVLPALLALGEFDSESNNDKWIVDDSIPKTLGDYRIIQEIGRGGMGIVFEAMHTKMRRRVALKILPKSFVKKPNFLNRFLAEARSAGMLHHTNIVPVFEVAEENGLHYYTMQYIHGDSLDRVINDIRLLRQKSKLKLGQLENPEKFANVDSQENSISRQLATRFIRARVEPEKTELNTDIVSADANDKTVDRRGENQADNDGDTSSASDSSNPTLNRSQTNQPQNASTVSQLESRFHNRVASIGVQVAKALQYAHDHGVLHRDIKPSNLLLDSESNVWVTDFGLAKYEADDLTRTGDIVGTLRYMAPERFAGKGDPRSDIYSLGLTLYELCTLRAAFESDRGTSLQDVVDRSSVVQPRLIDATVPADLETIILKAIDIAPERRYQTADAMAEDLELFLSDRPIKARRITKIERLWRLCRRNPVTAMLTAASILLLITVAVGSTLAAIRINNQSKELKAQNIRATNHLALTEETIEKMLVRIGHELTDFPQMDAVRHGVYSDALEMQNKLLLLEPDDSTVTINTAAANRRMAKALRQIGQAEQANERLDESIRLLDSLSESSHEKYLELARAYTLKGTAGRESGKTKTAESNLRAAISSIEAIPSEDRDEQCLIELAVAQRQLGALLQQIGRVDEAAEAMQIALDTLGPMTNVDAHENDERMSALIAVMNSYAIVHRASGNYDKAEEMYRKVLSLYELPDDSEMLDSDAAHQMGITAINLGNSLMRRRKHDQATEAYEKSACIYERLRKDFPTNIRYQRMAARADLSLASAYAARDEDDSAESAYRSAISQSQSLRSLHGSDLATLDTLAVALNNLGNLLKKQSRTEEAIETLQQSIDLRQHQAELQPANLANIKSLALTHANLANLFMDESAHEEAHALLLDADQLLRTLLEANSQDPSYVRVADFSYALLTDVSVATNRYDDVVSWANRRFQISNKESAALRRIVLSLEKSVRTVNSDDALNDEQRKSQTDKFTKCALALIGSALDLGWTDDQNLLESEPFEWLQLQPEFDKLIQRASDNRNNIN